MACLEWRTARAPQPHPSHIRRRKIKRQHLFDQKFTNLWRKWPFRFLLGTLIPTSLALAQTPEPAQEGPSAPEVEPQVPSQVPVDEIPAQASPEGKAPAPDGSTRLAMPGVVLDAQTRKPIPDASVRIPDTLYRSTTDATGRFRLPPLPVGVYEVAVEAKGYAPRRIQVRVSSRTRLAPVLLSRPGSGHRTGTIEVEETLERPPEVVERTLSLPELQKVPGSFNDAVRAVQNLPGVARSPIGFLIVRGTEPQDTGYYIDGIRVPQIFHFLGLHTVVNSDMLEQVTFLPGNYSTRYGRTIGGVVDATTTEDIPQGRSGYLGVDLLSSVAFAKVPLREDMGLVLSVRRSYADFVLDKGLEVAEKLRGKPFNLGFVQAPRYWDYQAIYNWEVDERNFVHALVFGSHDTVKTVVEPPASVQPSFRADGTGGTNFSFDKAVIRWRTRGDLLTHRLTASFGPDVNTFGFGSFAVAARNYGLFVREDLSARFDPLPWVTLRTGLDGLFGGYSFDFSLPFDPRVEEIDPLAIPEPYTRTIEGVYFSPALFAETEVDVGSALTLQLGLRFDPFFFPGIYTTTWWDPRASLVWRPRDGTQLKLAAGRFGEQPLPLAIDPEYGGNPELEAQYALQYSVGLEHFFAPHLSLEATAYAADQRNLVVIPTTDPTQSGKPDFTNDGRGQVRGLELLLRHTPKNGLFGWLSYTLMQAERLDGTEAPEGACSPGLAYVPEGSCWYPFDFDQTHIFTAVASYELPHGWTIGGRFRYATGIPYTRITNAWYDVDRNFYQPLPATDGSRNDARIPDFHDLTLRIDKKTRYKRFTLNGYLEVINVYNRANPEAVDYNFDYSEEIYVNGLPIFPNLGIKVEL